jgi:succinyl-CoA synthetase alpha subunit
VASAAFGKPVVALIAGRTAPGGVSMGHAGAITWGTHGTWEAKRDALERAGALVCASLPEAVRAIGRALGRSRAS